MRVTLTDPHGPRAWRTTVRFLAIAILVTGWFIGIFTSGLLAVFGIVGFAMLRAARLLIERQGSRRARLEVDAGCVRVRDASWRDQTLRAADITGATTARIRGGFLLSLQHRDREQPLTLELATAADLDAVRQALGIGHGGFGSVGWRTELDPAGRAANVSVLLGAVSAVLVGASLVGFSVLPMSAFDWTVTPLSSMGGIAFVASIVAALVGLGSLPTAHVVMKADGLQLRTAQGWITVPYAAVGAADADESTLSFATGSPLTFVRRGSRWFGGPTDDEARIILAQVEAAAQRARGHGVEKQNVTARLELLQKNGQSVREWLARLAATAQTFAGGYRGAAIEADDLWAVLEDPDAAPELRVAATRILRESAAPEVRTRIANAVAAVRDEETSLRLRIALDDEVDEAALELEALEEPAPIARAPEQR